MTSIRQLLAEKKAELWSTSPEASVYDALVLLAEKNIGALLVLNNGELVGVVSERDYTRKVVLHGKVSMETTVGDIMTADVITVGPEIAIEDAMALMTEKRIRHLPVIEGTKIVGLISIGDLVSGIIAYHEFTIYQLEKYICGGVSVR